MSFEKEMIQVFFSVIKEHGVLTAIIGAVSFFFVLFIRSLSIVMIKKIFVCWTRAYAEKNKNTLTKKINVSYEIDQALFSILLRFNADRAYVFEYHNGGVSNSGIPFAKVSNTFEKTHPSKDIEPQIGKLKDLPIGMMAYWNYILIRDGGIRLSDISVLKERDLGTYMILKDQKIKSVYVVSILDFKNRPIGFIGIDFCEEERILTDEEYTEFSLMCVKLCGLLLYDDKADQNVCRVGPSIKGV